MSPPAQQTPTSTPAQQRAAPAAAPEGAVVACRPTAEVEQTADRLIEMADTNGDGKISRIEATSTANFLLGGFFFRADTNGDGTVTPEEGRQAREELMSQRPALASLLREVRGMTGQSPFAFMAMMLDVEYGKPLTVAEARDAAKRAGDGIFALADGDKDGFITAAEAREAAASGSRMLGHAAFQAADTDKNGRLSFQEFQGALQGPARVAFDLANTSKTGELSEAEAANAANALMGRLWIYSPPPAK
ncbi:MAG: EF-hand domain-containing protein [Byssovorax sp.]